MKRTDPHRPGAIVPTDYSYRLSYSTPGWGSPPDPPWNIPAARALCEAIGWGKSKRGVQMFGHIGKCGVCGAAYVHGDIWEHTPTGDLVHVGHDCVDKYEMLAEREDFCAALEARKRNRAARIEHERRTIAREAFLNRQPDRAGLEAALKTDHHISRDLDAKLSQWGSLSEKQVALAFKLAKDAATPKPKQEEIPKGEHKGTIGKRETFALSLQRIVSFDRPGSYGGQDTGYVWIFRAADGSDVVWFTSSPPCNKPSEKDAGSGQVFGRPIPCEVKGTVKKHEDRKGRPQTILSRVSVKWPEGLPQTWDELWANERKAG